MSPITGLLPGHPAESLRPRLHRDRHDPAGRTSQIHRNPRTTGDSLVAPARVLLARVGAPVRAARGPSADDRACPADTSTSCAPAPDASAGASPASPRVPSAPVRKQTSERSDEGTIGRPKLRTLMLASQDRELVPQYQEFHVLGELGPPIPNEQPQNSSERKVSEGEEHR